MPLHHKKPMSWFKKRPQVGRRLNEAVNHRLGESLVIRQMEPLVCLLDGTIICQKQARKAISDGLDARTFQAVLRDKAKGER